MPGPQGFLEWLALCRKNSPVDGGIVGESAFKDVQVLCDFRAYWLGVSHGGAKLQRDAGSSISQQMAHQILLRA